MLIPSPMITCDEYSQVQEQLNRHGMSPQSHQHRQEEVSSVGGKINLQ